MSEHPDTTAAIRRGDPDTLERVLRDALPGLLRAARAAGLDQARAEDAVQSAVLVFMRRKAEFDGRARAGTWLHGILFRTIADERRDLRRDREREDIDLVMEGRFREDGRWGRPPAGPERELARREIDRMVAECLDHVPDRQRLAFTLRQVEGFTTSEVCKILEVSANNLGVMLLRARNRLRECLEHKSVEGSDDAVVQ